jgi:type I restriction enzyme, S subunit
MRDGLGSINDDWVEIKLKELTNDPKNDIIDGPFGSNLKANEYVNKGIPVFKIQNIKANKFLDKNIRYVTKEKAELLKRHSFKSGDLIITKLGNPLGLCCEVPSKYTFGIIVADLLRFRPNERLINKQFLKYCINSSVIQGLLRKITKGTTRPRVNLTIVRELPFKLPPIPEQRAIVAKIEQFFSSLDSGIADFEKAQVQLKIYRQAVLKKAFEGELTKKWREKQTNLPTAEKLLEQIKVEQQNHYQQKLDAWKIMVGIWETDGKKGKKPSRISKPKNMSDIEKSDIENYDTLPSNWIWSRFGNVTYKIGDIDHKMPKSHENGLPYISTGNIKKDGVIDFENAKTISRMDFDRLALKIKPEKGDIIFPRYGTIGRNILISFSREFLVSYSCAIIKNISKLMNEQFSYYYSLSPVIQKEIKRYTVETTQKNIGITSIEKFVFPLCSKLEQHQIVQKIESRLSVCDKVEQTITESLKKAKTLRQSILKKAFEGKLLSETELNACKQEKDYEPASELLKKIQVENVERKLQIKQKKEIRKK